MSAKKEYQRRVSPIVLRGGRSRLIHKRAMKEASESRDAVLKVTASLRLSDSDRTAAAAERVEADIPNHMNRSHVISSVLL